MKEGFTGISSIQNQNSELNPNKTPKGVFEVVRVLDVILDENHLRFDELGGYTSIGTVIFQHLNSPNLEAQPNNYAFSLLPNTGNYPLVNELVCIINLKIEGNNSKGKSSFYYIGPINVWNSQHHNALPNTREPLGNSVDVEGNVNLKLDTSTTKGKFVERGDINPLKKLPGDILYEGRNGNSLRLGSVKGEPFTVIRNGQNPNPKLYSWVPITEDLNLDQSLIVLTTNQKLNLNFTNNFSSLRDAPIRVELFTQPQILAISDRVILKAKKDGILIEGEKFVHIGSPNTVGISSNKSINLASNSINFGGDSAPENLVLGNKLMSSLGNLTSTLSKVLDLLSDLKDFPGGEPIPSAIGSAMKMLKPEVDSLNDLFSSDQLLSKISRTF